MSREQPKTYRRDGRLKRDLFHVGEGFLHVFDDFISPTRTAMILPDFRDYSRFSCRALNSSIMRVSTVLDNLGTHCFVAWPVARYEGCSAS
jgi:hypothetical protein